MCLINPKNYPTTAKLRKSTPHVSYKMKTSTVYQKTLIYLWFTKKTLSYCPQFKTSP